MGATLALAWAGTAGGHAAARPAAQSTGAASVGDARAVPVAPPAASALPPASSEPGRPALARLAVVNLPDAKPGIGFDDLGFSAKLDQVLVPAGRTGRLDLVATATGTVHEIAGFTASRAYSGGHDDGVTSADAGDGVVFATNRSSQQLAVVDPATRRIRRSVKLAAHPDYVRYVRPTREVWVTEPDADQIEIFTLDGSGQRPTHAALVSVNGGPESLVIDAERARAYTHLWRGTTVAIDVRSRTLVARWRNGCRASRGIALDAERGLLVTGCAEGKATVADTRDGRLVSTLAIGAGVDVIAFAPRARHVYLPSAATATMVVAALSTDGHLTELGRIGTAPGAHCVTTDQRGNAYVCDPAQGRLLVIHDGLVRPVH